MCLSSCVQYLLWLNGQKADSILSKQKYMYIFGNRTQSSAAPPKTCRDVAETDQPQSIGCPLEVSMAEKCSSINRNQQPSVPSPSGQIASEYFILHFPSDHSPTHQGHQYLSTQSYTQDLLQLLTYKKSLGFGASLIFWPAREIIQFTLAFD